ncbi:MAG TPA: MFS transporter [Mycobacterium sp.]
MTQNPSERSKLATFRMAGASATQILIYYARNVLGNANLYTIMTLLSAGTIFVVGPLIPKMVRTFGKKNSYQIAGVVAAVGGVGIFLAPASQLWLVFVSFFVLGAALAAVNSPMFSLEADTVEYGEWSTGVRSEGIVYPVFSFTRKVGQALGGAAASYALTIGSYNAALASQGASQPDSAITWIRAATGLVPAILIVLALVIMHFYPLTDTRFAQIVNEITQRRIAGVQGGAQSAGTNPPASEK